MKNKRLLRLLPTIAISLFFPTVLFAQWGFTATLKVSGKCEGYSPNFSFPINGLPTKNDCESLKKTIQNMQFSTDGCRIYYVCTACTGSDMAGAQASSSVPGKISINGAEKGQAYFTPSPGQSVQEWISGMQQKSQTFTGNNPNAYLLPKTENKSFDNAYAGLMDNSLDKAGESNVYRKGGIANNNDSLSTKRWAVPQDGLMNPDEDAKTEESYKEKGGYQFWKEEGKRVGVDISKYFTEEEWNKPFEEIKNMHATELSEWNNRHDKFISDVSAAQNKQLEEDWAKLKDNPNDNTWSPSNQNTSQTGNNVPTLEYGAVVTPNQKPVFQEINAINENALQLSQKKRETEDNISSIVAENIKFAEYMQSNRFTDKEKKTYQEKITKNQSKLRDLKTNLQKLKQQQADQDMDKYRQQLAEYEKMLNDNSSSILLTQREAIKREMDELNQKIVKGYQGISFEVTALEMRKEQEEIKRRASMSNVEKQQEINIAKARNEWLQIVDNMSPKTLNSQEKNYKTLVAMAGAAEYSYEGKQGLPNDGSLKECDNSILTNIISKTNENNSYNGFHCELLQDKNGNYILSFRGTEVDQGLWEEVKDIGVDVVENFQKTALLQTGTALKVTEEILEELNKGVPPPKLQLTGHSLGGRLAAEASIKYGLVAYTFNAANIALDTRNEIGINNKGNIINTVSANDFLTFSPVGLGNSKGGTNTGTVSSTKTTYYAGYTNVIKEAQRKEILGITSFEAHEISFLRQALEQAC